MLTAFQIYNLMQTIWEGEFYCCKKQYPALSIKLQILSNACFYILQVVLCNFAEAFSHHGGEGMGTQK